MWILEEHKLENRNKGRVSCLLACTNSLYLAMDHFVTSVKLPGIVEDQIHNSRSTPTPQVSYQKSLRATLKERPNEIAYGSFVGHWFRMVLKTWPDKSDRL